MMTTTAAREMRGLASCGRGAGRGGVCFGGWVTASPIVLNQAQGRSLYQRGVYNTNSADQDTFWFAAQAGYEYTIDLSSVGPTLRANLYLLSLDGSTVLASDTRYTEPGTPKSLRYTFATPGRYFVRIGPYSSSYDHYGDYELR